MQSILILMYPGLGALARAQTLLMDPNADLMGGVNEPINMVQYVSNSMRRQIVKTVLVVMKEYSYCSIANQLCILILDQIKTLLDVIDVVSLQKFVIQEFRERHLHLYDLHKRNREQGGNHVIKRYHIDHLNMQSAQVNQMVA